MSVKIKKNYKNKSSVSNIEINEDFKKALFLIEETSKNIFITGRAGTGKSTLLNYFRNNTKKQIVVLAPTGVASLNVNGQTIHSFFRFSPNVTLQSLSKERLNSKLADILENIQTIVIDEISMVRADIMDCIDYTLRRYKKSKQAFGGIQMIFIGDLYQLPPVVSSVEEKEMFKTKYKSPYFFDSDILQNIQIELIELNKIYRQKDSEFIDLLNKIRNNSITDFEIQKLNTRVIKNFNESEYLNSNDFRITLTTTNLLADSINTEMLSKLSSKKERFIGEIFGEFDYSYLPTNTEIDVKTGAQVMMLNNDSQKRWVNGSIGKIIDIKKNKETGVKEIIVELNNCKIVNVEPYTWELSKYVFDKQNNHLDVEFVGSFTQYPLRLAWAVTIHKSQGKTFEQVTVDLGKGSFAHGQVYVALSRCVSFEGLVLKKPIKANNVWVDYRVRKFLTEYQYEISEKEISIDEKIKIIKQSILNGSTIKIIYLKNNDTKSERQIIPSKIGQMCYMDKDFLGVDAYCMERKEERVFRVDRILKIELCK